MKKLLAGLLVNQMWATVITLPPTFIVEEDHVVFMWLTDTTSTTKVKWYSVTDPANVTTMLLPSNQNGMIHKGTITTLTNGVTYKMQGCSLGTTGLEVCGSEETVVIPQLADVLTTPQLPDTAWQTAAGDGVAIYHPNGIKNKPVLVDQTVWPLSGATGSVVNIGANCLVADAGASKGRRIDEVNAAMASLTGSRNIEVRIDPGCAYAGRMLFPVRPSHAGWVTYTSTGNIPPVGVRATSDWTPQMPTFIHNTIWGSYANGSVTPNTSDFAHMCAEGDRLHAYGPNYRYQVMCMNPGHGITPDTGITIASYSGGLWTTATPHGFSANDIIDFTGTKMTGMDSGGFRVSATNLTNTTFRIMESVTGTFASVGTVRRMGTWRYQPYVAEAPGAPTMPCTIHDVYRQTDFVTPTTIGVNGTEHQGGLWFCFATNTWEQWNVYSNTSSASHLFFPANAQRYRFEGIKLTRHPGYRAPFGNSMQGKWWNYTADTLIADGAASDIIFDRIVFDGIGGVARVGRFASLLGARNAVINSSLYRIRRASSVVFPVYGNSIFITAIAFHVGSGPGPYLFENNYIDCVGITIFDDLGSSVIGQADNVVVRRNYMLKPTSTMPGHPNWDGWYYHNRHHFEQKRGKRYLYTGNQLYNNFAADANPVAGQVWGVSPIGDTYTNQGGINGQTFPIASASGAAVTITSATPFGVAWEQGAATGRTKVRIHGSEQHDGVYNVTSAVLGTKVLKLTPTCAGCVSTTGTVQVIQNPVEITDLIYQHNYVQGSGTGPSFAAQPAQLLGTPTYTTKRILITNNVFDNISSKLIEHGGFHALQGGYPTGMSPRPAIGIETTRSSGGVIDLTFTNNIIHNLSVGAQGDATLIYGDYTAWHDQLLGRRHTYTHNILHSTPTSTVGLRGSFAAGATAQMVDPANSVVRDNVFCCNLSAAAVPAAVPSGSNSLLTSTAGIGFFNESGANFRLRSNSAFRNYGPDFDAAEAEQGLVKNARVRAITATGVTISYYAPDADSCIVEYGTSAKWGTGTRISDAPYHATHDLRVRNVPITGLSSGVEYHHRILCAVEQPSGSFRTGK